MIALLYLVCWLVVLPIASYFRGFVAITLWAWFVTPAFGVAAPSIHLAVGIMVLLTFVMPLPGSPTTEANLREGNLTDPTGRMLGRAFGVPVITLGVGWVWKWLEWGL